MKKNITPDRIMQIGLGFWAAKTLLSAVELGLFTQLAKEPMSAEAIGKHLNLHPRSLRDFLDALVSLGMLQRTSDGLYHNSPETDQFLDANKSSYIGGILEMANHRLYPFWGSLTEALKTGEPQNEAKSGNVNSFDALYSNPEKLEEFLGAMTGISVPTAQAIAQKFPWQKYNTFIDVGGAQGGCTVQLALAHPHLKGGNFDLPAVRPVFEKYVKQHGLDDRLMFYPGDFFQDALPTADVLVMGHILHDWNLQEKQMLLQKAYDALPVGGALIIYEALIDDERQNNTMGLLMSLNMLIETSGGFDYTGADCSQWMRQVGFGEIQVEHLVGPDSMVIGIK
ncbi:methyltransferase [Euhalothece natronophila Z-M001]|uniref:Methyltransferase n=1 Tax=Euhalothece natronophila Z-M001 TaxID=522448 RepID=A0A5B8NNU6_9CHRO|nr:methyltransferase [Euhalothece natronophila]QDZ40963.1 methyltransferase [Euhalothece natronophila Z-M001]